MTTKTPGYRWWVLVQIVVLNVLVTGVCWNYVIMVAGDVVGDLGLAIGDWGWLWSAIALGVLLFSMPAGLLGDRLGSRRALAIGLVVAGLSLLLRGSATGAGSMFLTMLGFGLALGLVLSNFPKAIAQWFPPGELGLANGVAQAGVGVGLGAATLLTPILLEPLGGWRSLTRLLGLLTLGLAALWLLGLREPEGDAGAEAPERESLGSTMGRVLRSRDVSLLSVCYLLYVGGYLGAVGYLPTYFMTSQGLSPEAAGAVMSLGPWSFIAGSLLLPTLSDRLGLRRRVYLPGMLAGGLALLAAAQLPGASAALAMAAFGFTTGVVGLLFVIPPELDDVGESLAGTAIGVMTTAGFLGGFLSPQLGMALVAVEPQLGFAFWSLCIAASGLLMLAVRETGPGARRHRTE